MTDFPWSSFVAFWPYTPRVAAEEALGFEWPEYERLRIAESDAFTLMVFVDAGRVVRVDEAVFVLRKTATCDVLHLRSAG